MNWCFLRAAASCGPVARLYRSARVVSQTRMDHCGGSFENSLTQSANKWNCYNPSSQQQFGLQKWSYLILIQDLLLLALPCVSIRRRKKIYIYHAKYWLQWSCHVQRVILKSEIFNCLRSIFFFFLLIKFLKRKHRLDLSKKRKKKAPAMWAEYIFSVVKGFSSL